MRAPLSISDSLLPRELTQALGPDASVAKVARAHGVNTNQVFGLRRQYRQGSLGEGQETGNLRPQYSNQGRWPNPDPLGRTATCPKDPQTHDVTGLN